MFNAVGKFIHAVTNALEWWMKSYVKLQPNLIARIIVVLLCLPVVFAAADESLHSGPVVAKLHAAFLANMRAAIDFQIRYKQVQPTDKQEFDRSASISRMSNM